MGAGRRRADARRPRSPRRAELRSTDYARYPLKRLEDAAGRPRFASVEVSREDGDDLREVTIRLLLWATQARPVDPNARGFDQAVEEALVRFKHAYDRAKPAGETTPLVLGYVDADAATTKRLYPNTRMGTTLTGICDLATFRALSVFVGDVPDGRLAFARYASPAPAVVAPAADRPEYGRRGIDRILVYALLALAKRRGTPIEVERGVVSWPRHTLDEERRTLSVNHPEGYAVKLHASPLPGTAAARISSIAALRVDLESYGAGLGKAGPPSRVNPALGAFASNHDLLAAAADRADAPPARGPPARGADVVA